MDPNCFDIGPYYPSDSYAIVISDFLAMVYLQKGRKSWDSAKLPHFIFCSLSSETQSSSFVLFSGHCHVRLSQGRSSYFLVTLLWDSAKIRHLIFWPFFCETQPISLILFSWPLFSETQLSSLTFFASPRSCDTQPKSLIIFSGHFPLRLSQAPSSYFLATILWDSTKLPHRIFWLFFCETQPSSLNLFSCQFPVWLSEVPSSYCLATILWDLSYFFWHLSI